MAESHPSPLDIAKATEEFGLSHEEVLDVLRSMPTPEECWRERWIEALTEATLAKEDGS